MKDSNASERLPSMLQITNAELAAILEVILYFQGQKQKKMVILTNSMAGCNQLKDGWMDEGWYLRK